jgi:Ca-activated chloride channel family protein
MPFQPQLLEMTMHLSTQLDCDLVAVETDDELTLLIEINAPTLATVTTRPAATVQIVLDRSGSMQGDRLDGAKIAITRLIDRLDPTDNFGLVTFDDEVQVVVPAGPLTDKTAAKLAVAHVQSGGMTDLSAGYLRGLQEARRVATPAGATVLIISDGHANQGITDPPTLGKVAADASARQVTTSTLGFGLGYDEQLLAAVSTAGNGNELFAEEADTAAALIAGEVEGLLTQVAQACSLRVKLAEAVKGLHLLNDLPCVALDDGVMIELGSFYGGETRRLVMRLAIPGIPALGLAEVATLELTHVSLPDLVQHLATVRVSVNVVPGDQAAGRVKDPTVVSEALFQETQRAKKDASRLLSEGRVDEANVMLRSSSIILNDASVGLPSGLAAMLTDEANVVSMLADESLIDSARAAKSASYDGNRKNRQRGRQTTGGQLILEWHSVSGNTDGSLELAEWELVGIMRNAPAAQVLRSGDAPVSATQAAEIAMQLGDQHPAHAFFAAAAIHGGATATRT